MRKNDMATLELLNKGFATVKSKGIEQQLIKKWMGKQPLADSACQAWP